MNEATPITTQPDRKNAARRRNASLGAIEPEALFASIDPQVGKRFRAFLKPYPGLLIGAQTAALVSAAMQLALPLMIGGAVTAATSGKGNTDQLTVLVAQFFAAVVVLITASVTTQWLTTKLAQKVIFDVRRAMFAHLQRISLSFLDKTHVGRVMSRLQGDVNALQEFMEGSANSLSDMAMLVGIIVILLVMNVQLGLLTLVVLPILIGLRAIWLPHSKKVFRRARETASISNGALAENISGIRTVQAARREKLNFEFYQEKVRANFDAQVTSSRVVQIMTPAVFMLTGVAFAVIIALGGSQVLAGKLAVGELVAYIIYVQKFFDPIRGLSKQYTTLQRAMAAGHRVFELLDVPIDIVDGWRRLDLAKEDAEIEFDNVSFSYSPERPVLHNLSFRIEPQAVVALIGPTGSGKTSIISLVRRLYDANEGSVLVGGVDVRDATQISLGSTIGMVLQEPFLFAGTIEENIRYASDATFDQVKAAAEAVRANEFIEQLPDGYATQVGQRGRNLSVGQRQLISFARTLAIDPPVLILDEATANVDSFTELAIQRALKVLFAGRTCLIIAHRLATIRDADNIIVLRSGRIEEQGSHAELIAHDGLYSELCRSGRASFDDNIDAGTESRSVIDLDQATEEAEEGPLSGISESA